MGVDRWQQISRLYHAARERTGEERHAFLKLACGNDNALLEEVETLIADDSRAQSFFEAQTVKAVGDPSSPDAETLSLKQPRTILGSYRIERLLGRGGMGAVFLAYDTKLHRQVALKMVDQPAGSDTSRSRLLREARNTAALNHPNICMIHEVGEINGAAFIAMEYVEGQALSERLAGGPLPVAEALGLGIQAAEALAYAHEHRVVHRDFKAANAIVNEARRLKIVDFGLAMRRDLMMAEATTMPTLVPAGAAAGTPYAMAPEQVRGGPADARTDLWALGVLLYEMVGGAKPFQAQTISELFSAILRDAPAPLPNHVPVELQAVIERCLEKAPARRYQNASEISSALEAIQAGTVPLWTKWGYQLGRRRWLMSAASLLTVIAILAVINATGIRDWLTGNNRASAPIRLAVLPLENLSGDPEDAYLTAGIHETLVTELARISQVRVIARASAQRYKGTEKRIAEIAKELNVDFIVTGSVSRSGDRVRITAELIDAATEGHIWGKRYDRAMRNVFALQNEIITAIARQVRLQLTPEQHERLAQLRPVDPEAHEAYLKGMFYLNQSTPEGVQKGMALLHEAVAKDPAHPLPYAHLAVGYSTIGHGPSPPPDAFARARAAALQALELDDTVALAQAVLGELILYSERTWDWRAAEHAFQRATELDPSLARAHAHYAWYLVLFDRWAEGLQSMKRAQEVDPLNPLWSAWHASLYWWNGRYDEAIQESLRSLELNPNFTVGLSVLGRAYSDKARHDEAIATQEKVAALNPAYEWSLGYAYARAGRREDAVRVAAEYREKDGDSWRLALIHAALGQREEALLALESSYSPWMRNLEAFRWLRDDPRFQAHLRRMNLSD